MDEQSQRTALLSALTTEHFVLQTANSSTYAEASARSTLYVMALSSSLVAMGFLAGSADSCRIRKSPRIRNFEAMELAAIIPATAIDAIKTPNPALNRTARKLRLRVPSALCASAAG